MALPAYPLVNGIRHDWSCIEANFGPVGVILGIKGITYSHNLEPGEVVGTHAQILGRTRGQYKAEGSFEIYKAEYAEMISKLGDGYMEKVWNLTVSFSDTGTPIITDKLIGCRIKKPENSHAPGADPLVVKVDLSLMMLIENGKKPLTKMLGV